MGTDANKGSGETGRFESVNWRSAGWITLAAVALYAGFRVLPTGTNLHHLDFQVEGPGALEMCDPSRPQFIPVVEARSPVRAELRAEATEGGGGPAAGRETKFTLSLATTAGKAIGPVDLITVHTRKLHLLVVDETLADYQHLHPEPGAKAGEWVFRHTPKRGGVYRVFADFTPAATARGLYSFADYTAGAAAEAAEAGGPFRARPVGTEVERSGHVLALKLGTGSGPEGLRAGQPGVLAFTLRREDGGAVALEEVMDAYVHMVAFDEARSGFAHLHPRVETPGAQRAANPARPTFVFDVMIPQPGRYVVWAQMNVAGEEWFEAFELAVGM